MITALCSGRVVIAPSFGNSSSGKPYSRCSLACETKPDGSAPLLVQLFVMDPESIESLRAIKKGDMISAQGQFQTNTYAGKDGEEKSGYSLAFARVLTVAGAAKKKLGGMGEPP